LVRKAAEEGSPASQYRLGLAYAQGKGVVQDYVEAHKWLNLAAASGNSDAIKIRATVATLMTREQIAEAQRLAREWSAAHPNQVAETRWACLIGTALACFVIAVADGDTLTARCDVQGDVQNIVVRLSQIDAPERRQPIG
jgi:TPR repeat protein